MYKKLYSYKCLDCKKNRFSLKKNKKVCTICNRTKVSEKQISIFDLLKHDEEF